LIFNLSFYSEICLREIYIKLLELICFDISYLKIKIKVRYLGGPKKDLTHILIKPLGEVALIQPFKSIDAFDQRMNI